MSLTFLHVMPLCFFIFPQADEQREHVEVCAEGGVIVQKMASRVSEDGGAALIADYGHDGTKTDTFRVSVLLMSSPFSWACGSA